MIKRKMREKVTRFWTNFYFKKPLSSMSAPRPSKICTVCGRAFEYRKQWEKNWNEVRKCSTRCRNRRLGEKDRALERAIVSLLARRNSHLMLSEAAREILGEESLREHFEMAKMAARRLAAQNKVVVLDGMGRPTDPSHAKGDMRMDKGPAFEHC